MKTIANNITINKRVIALFVLLVLSSVKMFGQEVKNEIVVPASINTAEVAAAGDASSSQMELVSWLMGSKQSQVSNAVNTSSNGSSVTKIGKKQFINNGLTANRILSRVFLKKAMSSDSTIA